MHSRLRRSPQTFTAQGKKKKNPANNKRWWLWHDDEAAPKKRRQKAAATRGDNADCFLLRPTTLFARRRRRLLLPHSPDPHALSGVIRGSCALMHWYTRGQTGLAIYYGYEQRNANARGKTESKMGLQIEVGLFESTPLVAPRNGHGAKR